MSFVVLLAGCGHVPFAEYPGSSGTGPEAAVGIVEPGAREVVVVVNHNALWVGSHAGMFAGKRLVDPAGSYVTKRSDDDGWQGISLIDYVRYQLKDGPWIRLYRFTLSAETFAEVESRVVDAGIAMPLFCAAYVQNLIAGIGPFKEIPRVWWTSPTALARNLDLLIAGPLAAGACIWPTGAHCRTDHPSEGTRAALP